MQLTSLNQRWRQVAWLIVLMAIWPWPPVTFSQTITVPRGEVVLMDQQGTASGGVYLGHGLILTASQNVTAERYLWNASTSQIPPLAFVLFDYLDDGNQHPWEWPLSKAICFDENSSTFRPAYQTNNPDRVCLDFDLTAGITVHPPGLQQNTGVPIERLLYVDRASGIALLSVDEAALRDAFPMLTAASLDARPLIDNQPLLIRAGGTLQPVSIDSSRIQTTTNPLHQEDQAISQRSPVVTVEQDISDVDLPAIGEPYYGQDGRVVGLHWGNTLNKDETLSVYLSPVHVWANDLWTVQDHLQSSALQAVLEETLWPDGVKGAPGLGDHLAERLGNTGIDVLHYTLDLDIDPAQPFLSGTATITIRTTLHHLQEFSLDLDASMQVRSVQINDRMVAYRQANDKLIIELPTALDYGTPFSLRIDYRGQPEAARTRFSRFFTVGLEYDQSLPSLAFVNEPDGARTWFPANDHPRDRATFTFDISVPDGMVAVANGSPIIMDNNRSVWEMSYPMATYLATVAVGDYVMIEDNRLDIPLRNYAYRGTETEVAQLLDRVPVVMQLMESLFGPYPYDSYGHVVTPLPAGALEAQTMTILPSSLTQAQNEAQIYTLVVHELAHQWYGNRVTLRDWQDIWLNEGFATYAEWLALDARYQETNRTRDLRTSAEQAVQRVGRSTPLAFPHPHELFEVDSYQKGAWVLHMLRQQLGDGAFFEIMRMWASDYGERAVTSWDFFQLAELISGQDLTAFRQRWLESPGIPTFTIRWSVNDQEISVTACGDGKAGDLRPVDMQLLNQDSDKQMSVKLDLSTTSVQQFAIDFVPSEILVDPGQNLLAAISVEAVSGNPSCLLGDY